MGYNMGIQPEVWFRRSRFGGWRPTHWKGFLLMAGGMNCAALLAAAGALERNQGGHSLSLVAWVGATMVWAGTMVVSWKHSAPAASGNCSGRFPNLPD